MSDKYSRDYPNFFFDLLLRHWNYPSKTNLLIDDGFSENQRLTIISFIVLVERDQYYLPWQIETKN
jgi:hypothetical protein